MDGTMACARVGRFASVRAPSGHFKRRSPEAAQVSLFKCPRYHETEHQFLLFSVDLRRDMSAYHVEKQDSLPFPPTRMAGVSPAARCRSRSTSRASSRVGFPTDAPNILIVLMDDAGPGLPSTYGGEIHTPTLDRVVKDGISYNRFHTTAMCSPTRASLLTGRNHTASATARSRRSPTTATDTPGTFPRAARSSPKC